MIDLSLLWTRRHAFERWITLRNRYTQPVGIKERINRQTTGGKINIHRCTGETRETRNSKVEYVGATESSVANYHFVSRASLIERINEIVGMATRCRWWLLFIRASRAAVTVAINTRFTSSIFTRKLRLRASFHFFCVLIFLEIETIEWKMFKVKCLVEYWE